MSDIEGKAARVAASEAGVERVSMDTNRHEVVAGGGDPGNSRNGEEVAIIPTSRDYNLPNSKKIYTAGKLHPDIHVPFREISLAPTKTMSGEVEINEPVCVYDTSGPWGDTGFDGNVENGLPPLRVTWIRDRGDVEEIQGRAITPRDDGFLSEVHAATARRNGSSKSQIPNPKKLSTLNHQPSARRPLRARSGCAVTQLAYARQGIITPEMEFIAIRENMRAVAGGGDSGQSMARANPAQRRRLQPQRFSVRSFWASVWRFNPARDHSRIC